MCEKMNIIVLEDEPGLGLKEGLSESFPNLHIKIYTSIKELVEDESNIREADIFIFDIDMQKDSKIIYKNGNISIQGKDTKIGGIIMALYYLILRSAKRDDDCIIYTVTGRDEELRQGEYKGIYILCKLLYEKLGFKISTGDKQYNIAIEEALKMLAEKLKNNFFLLNSQEIREILEKNDTNILLNSCLKLKSKFSDKVRNILIGSLFSYCSDNSEIFNEVNDFIIKASPKGELVRRLYDRAHGELHKGKGYICDENYKKELGSVFGEGDVQTMIEISINAENWEKQQALIKGHFGNNRGEFIINIVEEENNDSERAEKILKFFFRIPLQEYIKYINASIGIESVENVRYIYGNSKKTLQLLDQILEEYKTKVIIKLEETNYQRLILIFLDDNAHSNFSSYLSNPQGGSLSKYIELSPEIANGLYLFNKKENEDGILHNCFTKNYEQLSNSFLNEYLKGISSGKALVLVIDSAKYTKAKLSE